MKSFTFKVYNTRRECDLKYRIDKTTEGWDIAHISKNGPCSPDGSPLFYANFNQDHIVYPSSFGNALDWLWRKIDSDQMPYEEAQAKLQELADWVSLCEKNQPKWKGYNV